jgi:DNA polymerase III delta prime subunit
VGKGLVARLFAVSLVCTQPGEDGTGCGSCVACRKAAHGNHPDVLVVTRLPKKETRGDASLDDDDAADDDAPTAKGGELRPFIVVQQIRELNQHAAYAPREGRRRVFLIDPADRMNLESQNALLKTLEEPGGQTIILLVASASAPPDRSLALFSGRLWSDASRRTRGGSGRTGNGPARSASPRRARRRSAGSGRRSGSPRLGGPP